MQVTERSGFHLIAFVSRNKFVVSSKLREKHYTQSLETKKNPALLKNNLNFMQVC